MRLRALVPLALIGAALVPGAAEAQTSSRGETRYLDTYDRGSDRFAGPLQFRTRLLAGVPYVAEVTGTASYFTSGYRRACGSRPGLRPIFPSLGRRNGRTGIDPEFIFAEPLEFRGACAQPNPPFSTNTFLVNAGRGYVDPVPLGATLTRPTLTHRYRYPLLGTGARPRFRFTDSNTRDNYGRFRITIRRAPASSCGLRQFAQFGFATEAECRAAASRR